MHGRKAEISTLIKKVKEHSKVALLTDNTNNLKLIANGLLNEGLKDRKIYICENLSLDKERIRKFDVFSLQKARIRGLNVIIILDDE